MCPGRKGLATRGSREGGAYDQTAFTVTGPGWPDCAFSRTVHCACDGCACSLETLLLTPEHAVTHIPNPSLSPSELVRSKQQPQSSIGAFLGSQIVVCGLLLSEGTLSITLPRQPFLPRQSILSHCALLLVPCWRSEQATTPSHPMRHTAPPCGSTRRHATPILPLSLETRSLPAGRELFLLLKFGPCTYDSSAHHTTILSSLLKH